MIFKALLVLLCGTTLRASELVEQPMKPSKPVPKQCPENIKIKHTEAKKRHMNINMHVPGAPKLVYRRLEV
jgi:hypothetical protein